MKQKKKTSGKRAVKSPPAAAANDDSTYYPYGRTYARDLFFHHNPRTFRRLDALVLQCGDLRDVTRTSDDAKRKYGRADLTFVLSNERPEVLARNLFVLHAISKSDEVDKSALVYYVRQLTYTFLLEETARDFWLGHMRECLAADWTRADAQVRVLDKATMDA
ncbi:hypothetical protein H9P43_006070 [Blastocladiella emersonii ATCC 22665]|nr:hypothetical protein H9P43_006070 [Blastocladiella emersonii ATCC 22665]